MDDSYLDDIYFFDKTLSSRYTAPPVGLKIGLKIRSKLGIARKKYWLFGVAVRNYQQKCVFKELRPICVIPYNHTPCSFSKDLQAIFTQIRTHNNGKNGHLGQFRISQNEQKAKNSRLKRNPNSKK